MALGALNYDHPAYIVPYIYSGSSTAGANGTTTKWAAFTAQKLETVHYATNIASTSSTTPLLYIKSGTTTSTRTLSAVSSAATSANRNELSTAVTLARGDQFWVAHGTDATVSLSVAIETHVIPGSDITVP